MPKIIHGINYTMARTRPHFLKGFWGFMELFCFPPVFTHRYSNSIREKESLDAPGGAPGCPFLIPSGRRSPWVPFFGLHQGQAQWCWL